MTEKSGHPSQQTAEESRPSSLRALVGQTVGNYRVVERLGEGGAGEVYLAEHPEIGRKVAIKFVRRALAEEPMVYGRFLAEARAASAIQHPNIVEVLDFGHLPDGQPYIVMEYLAGESLAARLARIGRIHVAGAVEIAFQVAGVLTAAHGKGIVHRDLKPDNVFLVPDRQVSSRDKVKVLDFGIAKLQGGLAHESPHTRTGSLVGTPLYMSPEQCRGIREIDARTDIYALGAMLFEMLTGQPPFLSAGLGDLMDMHMNLPPPLLRDLLPTAPRHLEVVVARALAKQPEDRFRTAAEMQAALHGDPARTPSLVGAETLIADTSPGRIDVRRKRSRATGATAFLLSAAATFILASRLASRLWPPPSSPSSSSSSPPSSSWPPSPSPSLPPAPTPPSLPAAEPPPAAAATVTLRIESEPPGALVTDVRTREVLGKAPLTLHRPPSDRSLELRLSKPGFLTGKLVLPLGRDGEGRVVLPRRSASRPPATAGLEDL